MTALPHGVRHVRTTQHLKSAPSGRNNPAGHLEVMTPHGWTVRVYDLDLCDWPDGSRTVYVEGLHIKVNGEPGRTRRSGSWADGVGERLPTEIAEVVEAARPGWWTGEAAR